MEAPWLQEKRQAALDRILAKPGLLPGQQEALMRLERQWKRDGLALKTRYVYALKARRLGQFLGKDFEAATKEDLKAFLDEAGKTLSPVSLQHMKGFVKLFYKALLRPDEPGHPEVVAWLQFNARLMKTKMPEDLLTTEEIKRMAQATTHPRDRAIAMVLYESAARTSELVSMRVGDMEFDAYGARATLRGKTGQRKVRLVSSVPDLQAWLECHPYRDDPSMPAWLSWGHQNHHKPLMRNGVRRVVCGAADIAGIRKRVHPHLLRHSRLTELAKQLSESELKVFAGWTANSDMARVYIHLSGDDVDRKMLENAGLRRDESEAQGTAMKTTDCPRCHRSNSPANAFCSACTLPLGQEAAEWQVQQELLMEHLPRLLGLLQHPLVFGGNDERTEATLPMERASRTAAPSRPTRPLTGIPGRAP